MPLRVEEGVEIASLTPDIADPELPEISSIAPASLIAAARKLNINWVEQEQTEWCWAACTRMVLSGFNKHISQCRIVESLFGEDCCGDPDSWNQGCDEEDIQTVYEHWKVNSTLRQGTVSFGSVRKQIDEFGQPVEICVNWFGGGAHVILMYGYSIENGDRWVRFHDSLYGTGKKRFSDMKEYRGEGKWALTWFAFRQ